MKFPITGLVAASFANSFVVIRERVTFVRDSHAIQQRLSLSSETTPVVSVSDEGLLHSVDGLIHRLLAERNETWKDISQQIHQRIENVHAGDCTSSLAQCLATEACETAKPINQHHRLRFQNVTSGDHLIAIQSTERTHLLNQTSIDLIRQHAEAYWERQNIGGGNASSTTNSRFTYQRKGNYEAHIADLGPQVNAIVNETLQASIYPVVRDKFSAFLGPNPDQQRLFVYDSLYIRYNATEAQIENKQSGAGQPLHRDLSLVSVNIMMNDASEFEGGGTFFENQLREQQSTPQQPLKPTGTGHCLIHSSAERHAGANTRRGVRDVMVLFVSAACLQSQGVPSYIASALLKQGTREPWWKHEPFLCSLCHNRLALDAVPNDGEAFQYLGNALTACASQLHEAKDPSFVSVLELACQCYRQASIYTPGDGRIYNNWGLCSTKLRDRSREGVPSDDDVERIYQKGLDILEQSYQAGCDVEYDRKALRLNYALAVSNQDRFAKAVDILDPIVKESARSKDDDVVISSAQTLHSFCKRRASLTAL